MKKFLFSLALLSSCALIANPKYTVDVLGPASEDAIATSINDFGEVAGFFHDDSCKDAAAQVFYWSEAEGTIILGQSWKSVPKISTEGRVYYTHKFPAGWFSVERVRPVVWSQDFGEEEISLPEVKWAFKEAYINAISDSGLIVVGDSNDPSGTKQQQVFDGHEWMDTPIEVHAINNNNVVAGAYRHQQNDYLYQLPALVSLSGEDSFVFNYVGALFSINNHDNAGGVYLEEGKKRGLLFNLHADNYQWFVDFWFRNVNDNGLAIASSVKDLDKEEYLIDLNKQTIWKVQDLIEDENIQILYIFDINAKGDLCGVGAKDGRMVALRLKAK
jgi:hypothetical protein